jgi:hypothetical protein
MLCYFSAFKNVNWSTVYYLRHCLKYFFLTSWNTIKYTKYFYFFVAFYFIQRSLLSYYLVWILCGAAWEGITQSCIGLHGNARMLDGLPAAACSTQAKAEPKLACCEMYVLCGPLSPYTLARRRRKSQESLSFLYAHSLF